jgi:hypothetical protein
MTFLGVLIHGLSRKDRYKSATPATKILILKNPTIEGYSSSHFLDQKTKSIEAMAIIAVIVATFV